MSSNKISYVGMDALQAIANNSNSKDSNLATAVSNLAITVGNNSNSIAQLSNDIASEADARSQADYSLSQDISAEADARSQADQDLNTAIGNLLSNQNIMSGLGATSGDANKYLKGDGTFDTPQAAVVADQSLNATSTNAVANKPVTEALSRINNIIRGYISTSAAVNQTKYIETGAIPIQTGMNIRVLFTEKCTYPGGDIYLGLTKNGTPVFSAKIKVYKAGVKQNLVGHNGYWLDEATKTFEIWQAGTTLDLMFDGTDWVIVGNPVLESWSTTWNDNTAQAGYRVYADGYIELWDVYYTTTAFTTLTYNNVNYTNAVEFKVEFAGTPNLRAGCVSQSNNEMSYSEWIYACCPLGYRRHRGHSYDFQSPWFASGY